MPLLRYDTGDKIIINKEPCPCGLPLPTMKILGRKRTELFIGGKSFFPIELENILYETKLTGVWYQIKISEGLIEITCEHRNKKDYQKFEGEKHERRDS